MTDYKSKDATLVAHWPTGPVYVCEEHAKQIETVGSHMGIVVALTVAESGHKCSNCISENK